MGKGGYGVMKREGEKGVEEVGGYMEEKGESLDMVVLEVGGRVGREGVVDRVGGMEYMFVGVKGENMVMESWVEFRKVVEEEVMGKGKWKLKGMGVLWKMVDRRGGKNLYDGWKGVMERMGVGVVW